MKSESVMRHEWERKTSVKARVAVPVSCQICIAGKKQDSQLIDLKWVIVDPSEALADVDYT
jgi:hypothetical protein